MKSELFKTLKLIFPELNQSTQPDDPSDFDALLIWVNATRQNIMKMDMDEPTENLDMSYPLIKNKINTDALAEKISDEIQEAYDHFQEGDHEQDLDHAYSYEDQMLQDIVFKNINEVADDLEMALFVIQAENPYWLLVPVDNEMNDQLLIVFNDIYDEEMPMIMIG